MVESSFDGDVTTTETTVHDENIEIGSITSERMMFSAQPKIRIPDLNKTTSEIPEKHNTIQLLRLQKSQCCVKQAECMRDFLSSAFLSDIQFYWLITTKSLFQMIIVRSAPPTLDFFCHECTFWMTVSNHLLLESIPGKLTKNETQSAKRFAAFKFGCSARRMFDKK
ncbi:unnamed protein product [Caenorhabditis angaria]|uniref:Uncharacterized protein n=1 Tax=Caenorhabditis angaria TaxID=860376 RepID=A0A9P1N4R9_9PELO|nr:unnamed protein product [Caenorhabditis angaria]